jgi:hypothetical protein
VGTPISVSVSKNQTMYLPQFHGRRTGRYLKVFLIKKLMKLLVVGCLCLCFFLLIVGLLFHNTWVEERKMISHFTINAEKDPLHQLVTFTINMEEEREVCKWIDGVLRYNLMDKYNQTFSSGIIYVRRIKDTCINSEESSFIYVGEDIGKIYLLEYMYTGVNNTYSSGSIYFK